jgi:ribose-phosphate pyrophosphokinase
MCAYLAIPLGEAAVGRFPDGEINVRIEEDVRGRDIFLVQPTCPPVNENLMELLILVDAARRSSARRITAVIPYYGYARKDRKDEGRVPITAKLVANMIVGAGVDRVLALDLHATQIQGFFDIPMDHLFSFPVLSGYFKERAIPDLSVASPDVGGIRMARAFAAWLGAGLAVVDKRRISPEQSEPGFVIGEVKDRNILLVDDMITTGGSIANAAATLKEKGARDIYVATAHAVLCGSAVERLAAAPIRQIIATDSIPLNHKALQLGDRIKVLTVSGLLGEAVRRIHSNLSVSSLFARQ